MALSFPASPTVGQQYTDSNRTWEWNGQTWEAISSADFGTGSLTIPVSSTLPTAEGQIVFDGTTDTLHIGEGVGSVQIAKEADIPQTIIDLGIADGTAGQFLSTDGAGNFTFATPVDLVGATTLDELTDVTAAGSTAGQVLTSDGAGNFTFATPAGGGGGATTLDQLTDVTAATATNGQVLTADGAGNFTFMSIAGGGTETVTSLAYDSGTQILTFTDEAGADTALDLSHLLDNTDTIYTDADVATYLDGNLSANIIPDTDNTYDIGSNTNKIQTVNASRIYVNELSTPYVWRAGDIILGANSSGTVNAVRPYSTAFTSDLGSTTIPWSSTYTDNLTVNTSLSVDGTVNTNIIPDTTTAYDLGNNGARWNEVHANDGNFQSVTAFTYSSLGQMIFSSGSDFVFQGARINGQSANALDIGENSFPLKAIYTNNIKVNTTLTIPINNTPNTADGSMTWDGTNNKLYVGDGTTAIEIGAGGGGSSYTDADVATYLGALSTSIIPDTNATYDLGSAERKIRHLYLSDNSIKFVNAADVEFSMGVDVDGDLTFNGAKTNDGAIAAIKAQDLDMSGNRVLFANVYTNFSDLPDAGGYHGMFAHVHNDQCAYYAHASAWHKLANDADVPAAITDLGITDGTSGQVLTTDGAGNFTFTTVSGGGGSVALDDITDVTAAGSTAGQVLVSDGAGNYTFQTVPVGATTLDGLADVTAAGATNGQVLTADGAGAFTFTTPAGGGGGASTLDELTDVTAAGSANGSVLTSDGAGAFTFQAVTAQLGRNQYSGTTASIADQASENLDVTGCKTYTLFKISTDVAAWVVLYTDDAARTADTRTYADKGSDPSIDGVIAEVITTGAETVIVSPGVIGFNNEASPTSNIPMKVFNDSGGAATVTVTVDVLTLEV